MKNFTSWMGALILLGTLGTAGAQQASVQGHWKVVGWNLPGVVPVRGAIPLLTVSGEKLVGTTGCNSLSGSLGILGDAVRVGNLTTTRMACPDLLGKQEQAILDFLGGKTLTYAQKGDSLTLTNGEGHQLHLRRASQAYKP